MSAPTEDVIARDVLIHEQPILWARAMLEEAEKVRLPDARDAILARVGATLYARHAVVFVPDDLRRADQRWEETEPLKPFAWQSIEQRLASSTGDSPESPPESPGVPVAETDKP